MKLEVAEPLIPVRVENVSIKATCNPVTVIEFVRAQHTVC